MRDDEHRGSDLRRAALFDLDGVIRHFDDGLRTQVADRFGLQASDLIAAAFAPERLHRLVTGALRRADWVVEVGHAVASMEAAASWLDGNVGAVDEDVMALVDQLRGRGVPVAILTNGTDTIDSELTTLGIRHRFDAVVSTWEVGVAKPEPGAYLAGCRALGRPPVEVFFTDDRQENVDAASSLGIVAHRFHDVDGLARALRSLALL